MIYSPIMTEINPTVALLAEQIAQLIPAPEGDERLREELTLAQMQLNRIKLEEEGWQLLRGGSNQTMGATLEQVKEMSRLLRDAMAESPLVKQANNLRSSYTFSEPFLIPSLDGPTEMADEKKTRGRPTKDEAGLRRLRQFAESRSAREYVLGRDAQELISAAMSTDGVYLLLGDDATHAVNVIPLSEVTGTMTNPDFPGEIWAYRREWNPDPAGDGARKVRWYYTDRFEGKRQLTWTYGDKTEKVDAGKTIIDLSVNRQLGWQFGIPDLWAGHVWNRNYLRAIKSGMEVTDLMAWLSAKVKINSKSGSNATGVTVKKGGSAGSVQTYGEGNSIDTYATTGKAYDFDATRPIASIYALSVGVSVVDLLASPSAAGASYGSAQALAPGMRRAIVFRRDRIAGWMERVLQWATGVYHRVTPASIDEIDMHRQMQMVVQGHLSGLFHEDEVRPRMAYLAGITLKHSAPPEGYLLPNNRDSWERSDIDPKENPKGAGGIGQGQSNGTGGGDSSMSNDQRTDTIS